MQGLPELLFFLDAEKLELTDVLKIDADTLSRFPIFIVNWYVQQARAKYLDLENMQHYVFLLSSDRQLYGAVIYPNNWKSGNVGDKNFEKGTNV